MCGVYMYIFAQVMYRTWCAGKTLDEIDSTRESFIDISSELLRREPCEMKNFLFSQEWFLTQE